MSKAKACRICRNEFKPMNSLQRVCGVKCALAHNRQQDERSAKKRAKEQRSKDRAWKLANKPLRKLVAEAQKEFNKYIRLRDRFQNCISCNRAPREIETAQGWKPGGAWDCGHFLSVGSHPELRFCEDNAHRQCKRCNAGSGRFGKKGRTVSESYRENLIIRIGYGRIEWLEGPHGPANYTREQLVEIKEKYKLKAKDLENYDHENGMVDEY